MTTTMHWKSHPRVACFYGAKAFLQQRAIVYGPLVEAIAGPAANLERALLADQFDVDKFLDHLVPLSYRQGNYADMAYETLFRVLHGERARTLTPKYQACLEELAQPYFGILDALSAKYPVDQDWLPNQWKLQGDALLHAMARWSEPDALVPQADVVLVHPITDGHAEAYPLHTLICQEAIHSSMPNRLPAIVGLAWLVGCLGCHVPRYSDHFPQRSRAMQVGMLAMLPVALKAGEEFKLLKCDAATLSQAMTQWLPRNLMRPVTQVWGWWDAYLQVRPGWRESVIALGNIVD